MKRHTWKMIGVLGMAALLAVGGVFAGSAMADAYDLQYGDAADIARASRWSLDPEYEEGGWAGSNYYDNEYNYSSSSSKRHSSSSRSSSSTPDTYYGDCWWSGRTGHWDKQRDSGEKYQIQLKRGGTEVALVKTSNASYDFSSYMKQDGNYKFRVRLVRGSKHGGWGDFSETKWFEGRSSSSHSSSSSSSSSGGPGNNVVTGWNRDNRGWWYRYANGSYPTNCWQQINGKWYCFDANGYMRTGWINWNGVYYFCGPNGDMYTNCYTPDGYYVDGNGVWVH